MAEDPKNAESAEDDSAHAADADAAKSSDAGGETDDRLALVQAAFERGDYAEVRSLAAPLIAEGGPLAESAADLVQRTRVDPAQVGVMVGCLLFFCFIVWKYVL